LGPHKKIKIKKPNEIRKIIRGGSAQKESGKID
jgi:hypothetical protein